MTAFADYWHSTATKYRSWLSSLPGHTVRRALCALFLLWMLVSVVALARVLMPGLEPQDNVGLEIAVPVPSTANTAADPSALQALNLFGRAGAVAVDVEPVAAADDVMFDAKKTQLNLSLEGVVTASAQQDALAFIVYKGRQAQYYSGDKLPLGTRVKLVKVLADHVILDNGGRYESLWLYDKKNNTPAATSAAVPKRISANKKPLKVADKRNDRQATALANDYRQRLYKNPGSLAEVLRIVPAKENGQLIGYKVSPGRDKSQFEQLGFKPNDVVTSINGISLDEPSKALEIYKLMRSARQASFSLNRNGAAMDIVVSLEDNNS